MSDRSRAYDKSPEGQQYRRNYRSSHYDRIEINLPAGMRTEIDREAESAGMSRTAWILAAIEAFRQKEKD